MNYLSLDLETTGLSDTSQILEIGAVYIQDGKEVSRFNCLIDYPVIQGEAFALNMNAAILTELAKPTGTRNIWSLKTAQTLFAQYIHELPEKKITIAGKNVAGFDIPFLKRNGFDTSKFSHRVLDVGSLWAADFDKVPSLTDINKKLDRNEVAHTAIEDCLDVVAAIEYKRKK